MDILTCSDLDKLREERFGHKSNVKSLKEDSFKMYLLLTHYDDFGRWKFNFKIYFNSFFRKQNIIKKDIMVNIK